MPQYLKEEIRDRIEGAALEAFATEGFAGATMSGIARRAGISAGNIYRYHGSKQALFESVVPPGFVAELSERLGVRLEASRRVEDVRVLDPGHPYLTASEALLEFALRNRLRVVVVLGRGAGTRYAGFAGALVERLMGAALLHYRATDDPEAVPEPLRFDLRQVYENYVGSLTRILAHFHDPEDVRAAVEAYQRYHLVGLAALFE